MSRSATGHFVTRQELDDYGEWLTAKRAFELEELKQDNRRLRQLRNMSRERVVSSPLNARVSVRLMVEEVLPEFGYEDFNRAALFQNLVQKWPEHDARIRMGIDSTLALFVQDGRLEREDMVYRRLVA